MHMHILLRRPIIACYIISTPTSYTGVKQTWEAIGSKSECNMGAGEVYRQESPGKLSSPAECKLSCLDAAGCASITFFNDGWCSHYSTLCTRFKSSNNAVALRLMTRRHPFPNTRMSPHSFIHACMDTYSTCICTPCCDGQPHCV